MKFLTLDNIKSYPHEIKEYFDIVCDKGIEYARKNHKRNGCFYKEHTIWESDLFLNIDDWKDEIISKHPEWNMDDNENEIFEEMYDVNNTYLCDERVNLNIQLNEPIIVFAELGLWNGTFKGYKTIESGNIKDCLYTDNDDIRWFVDNSGEFRAEAKHHDGTNLYWYRTWKPSITEESREKLLEKVYEGKSSKNDILRLTEPLGQHIAKVYGWQLNL